MDKDYEDYLSNISDYTSHIPIPRQNIPELRNARNQLLTVISAVLKELEINKDISPITRNDILFKTQTMLLERNPEVQKNKIKNYRKIAANLPGHAMSGKKTAVLGCLMLALATALAAAVILGAEFSLSATVIGITTVAVVAPAAACTFFISRRQTGLAQAASQLANTFESCPDAVKSARR